MQRRGRKRDRRVERERAGEKDGVTDIDRDGKRVGVTDGEGWRAIER
jgi:hypothetical protein